ncbi:MAG: aldehyde ferredoxin oxidoreductase N-terminal domain-containing protein, partial [Candidatus Bathyarchaeia archaeon]
MGSEWAATVIQVDLGKGKVSKQILPRRYSVEFLGGRGVNARLLWDYLHEPGVDCFDPRNPLIFGVGPLTGTVAPCSGRTSITCKGAETNLYLKVSMGGAWGGEFKLAGYDHVVFRGASEKPVYLMVYDDDIELKDASHL